MVPVPLRAAHGDAAGPRGCLLATQPGHSGAVIAAFLGADNLLSVLTKMALSVLYRRAEYDKIKVHLKGNKSN